MRSPNIDMTNTAMRMLVAFAIGAGLLLVLQCNSSDDDVM